MTLRTFAKIGSATLAVALLAGAASGRASAAGTTTAADIGRPG